jgi:transcription antitermination factor NusA-like protein
MKLITLTTGLLTLGSMAFAQVQMSDGPALNNDKDNKMNRMLGGDENSFYSYRIRSKGKGTSFFVEKYDKKTLKPLFSKEVNLDEEGETKIEDVEYSNGNVFIFRRQYDKKADKMTLFYQTVSSEGVVSNQLKELTSVTSDHYEYVDFDIYPNTEKTKFVIKAAHKADKKAEYVTDFILMDAVSQKKVWTKTVNQNLSASGSWGLGFAGAMFGFDVTKFDSYGYIGLHLDKNDNIYYCVTEMIKNSTDKVKKYKLKVFTLNANEQTAKQLDLSFDDDYYVKDIEFSKSNDQELVIGGFLKDVVERKGRDLVKCGVFSFKVNTTSNTVAATAVKFFDDKLLTALESSPSRSRYFKYKIDYILPVGDAVYYIGEQYSEEYHQNSNSSYGMGGLAGAAIGAASNNNGYYTYEYMDVIVAKLNSKGEFEWIKNSPLRQNDRVNGSPHVFKQYIAVATSKNLYLLNDDHPKNIERYQKADFEPKDLKSVTGIHGSNFVCNVMSLGDGNVTTRKVLMKNDDYCFAPIQERNPQFMPPPDTEIFVPGANNEIFIYTEDRGQDRFSKIKFD